MSSMQLEEHYYTRTVLGYEAFGYVACASTGFLARSDALQQVGWFPTHSQDIGLALGIEFKYQRLLGSYHKGVLLRGKFPWQYACISTLRPLTSSVPKMNSIFVGVMRRPCTNHDSRGVSCKVLCGTGPLSGVVLPSPR
jgi:hypothetical protein